MSLSNGFSNPGVQPYGRAYLLMMLERKAMLTPEVEEAEDAVPSDSGAAVEEEVDAPAPGTPQKVELTAEQKLLEAALGGGADEAADGEIDLEDYYALLELSDINFSASQRQIKKAYHKMMVKHHPDKKILKPGEKKTSAETDPLFLAIKKAFDTLSDEKKRRGYDSKHDFDDAIPSGTEDFADADEFIGLYGPIFFSNSRFSTVKPVPMLGSADMPEDELTAFYAFWNTISSWREFTDKDEHNPDDADSRDEKRWMEQKNLAGRKKLKKKEMKRMRTLVERAYKADPRVNAMLRRQKAEREAAVAAKEKAAADLLASQKKAVEEGRQRRISQEKADKQMRESAKKAKQKASKAKSRARKKLSKACVDARVALDERKRNGTLPTEAASIPVFEDFDVMWLCDRVDVEEMRRLTGVFTIAEGENVDDVAVQFAAMQRGLTATGATLATVRSSEAGEAAQKAKEAERVLAEREAAAAAKREAMDIPWSIAELNVLTKAVKKIPGGARHRWEQIALMVNALALPHSRSEKECIAQAQKSKNGEAQANFGADDAFAQFKRGQGKAAAPKAAAPKAASPAAQRASPRAESKEATKASQSASKSMSGGAGRKKKGGGRVRIHGQDVNSLLVQRNQLSEN